MAAWDGKRVAVKEGFCWPAFFLVWMWGLYRVPVYGLGLLPIWVLLNAMVSGGGAGGLLVAVAVGLPVKIWIGTMGNRLRVRRLQGMGYTNIASVPADSPDEALAQARTIQTRKAG